MSSWWFIKAKKFSFQVFPYLLFTVKHLQSTKQILIPLVRMQIIKWCFQFYSCIMPKYLTIKSQLTHGHEALFIHEFRTKLYEMIAYDVIGEILVAYLKTPIHGIWQCVDISEMYVVLVIGSHIFKVKSSKVVWQYNILEQHNSR